VTNELTTVTVIYYHEDSLVLQHQTQKCHKNGAGRIIISPEFKEDKSSIAVCLGEITIINKIGDRILSVDIADE
jgi:uncharacterized protein (TIGR02922 family)